MNYAIMQNVKMQIQIMCEIDELFVISEIVNAIFIFLSF